MMQQMLFDGTINEILGNYPQLTQPTCHEEKRMELQQLNVYDLKGLFIIVGFQLVLSFTWAVLKWMDRSDGRVICRGDKWIEKQRDETNFEINRVAQELYRVMEC